MLSIQNPQFLQHVFFRGNNTHCTKLPDGFLKYPSPFSAASAIKNSSVITGDMQILLRSSTTKTILEVMYGIGYNDEKAFRNTFRKYSGLSPKEYQKKYNREMATA